MAPVQILGHNNFPPSFFFFQYRLHKKLTIMVALANMNRRQQIYWAADAWILVIREGP